jgi:diguanylate cyclase (GGDEF)-like protein/PAS domain S-box-containing protein
VTHRKQAEAALEWERMFLRALLDSLEEGIVACDAQGVLTLFNPATRRFHGLPAEPLTPERWAEYYDLYLPDGVTRMRTDDIPLFQALDGRPVHNVEMVIAPKHGERRVLLANGQAIFDERGEKLGAVVAMHDVTESKRTEQRLAHDVLHDALTGLPNRTLFLDRLGVALGHLARFPSTAAVLFIDLDNFKVVNDSLGHLAGDRVLVQVARRLLEITRTGETLARFGGDEFVLLCENLEGPQEATQVALRIGQAMEEPFVLDERQVHLSASVGIRFVDAPEHRPEELLRDADAAMYQAKKRGRARHELFDDSMRVAAVMRFETEGALRGALAGRQLRLWFQPIVRLASAGIVGAEALLRWQHPDGRLVHPSEFIPVAEQTGLIVPIGTWVLDEACRQLGEWRDRFGTKDLGISVNVSAVQLRDEGFPRLVAAALEREQLDPGSLCLEITESVLMDDPATAVDILGRLKELDVRLAIDDFGTGYSSLSYLQRFQVDTLKIDRSFLAGLGRDDDASTIVRLILRLAGNLGLVVVAEGVEDQTQLAELVELGCDQAQGFHFSCPLEAGAYAELLKAPGPLIVG